MRSVASVWRPHLSFVYWCVRIVIMPKKRKGPYRCEMDSPIYRQILKEVAKGYQFVACDKTNKIIRIKKNSNGY